VEQHRQWPCREDSRWHVGRRGSRGAAAASCTGGIGDGSVIEAARVGVSGGVYCMVGGALEESTVVAVTVELTGTRASDDEAEGG
jgi:hypothetical protein